ncbi:uncharacterized protein LOC121504816 [Cheilinus undulatus]|uniref:uncharacterized protein LOC121504816 n=1 Tax=Cheilinus undulatus TaxID=241271 RepID=UPI001BD5F154|nr:uncharacterized protein LOC121504816 [Cheilinus undulatus]
MDVMMPTRIVLFGEAGSGKRCVANLLCGDSVFEINHSSKSMTSGFQVETKSAKGRSITLVDTPDIIDSERPEEELHHELLRCITESVPEPHAFVIVLKVEKITNTEADVKKKMFQFLSTFSYDAVVFTRDDQLLEEMTIEEFVSQDKNLSDLVKKCDSMQIYQIVNDKDMLTKGDSHRSNQFQVAQLLNAIDNMMLKKNANYTKEDHTKEDVCAVIKEIKSAGIMLKEENNINNAWFKVTGPAAEPLLKAFSEQAFVALHDNKESRGEVEDTAEEVAEKLPKPKEEEADRDAVEVPGQEETTLPGKTLTVPSSRIVITGPAGVGKSIKVLRTYRIVLLGKKGAGKSSLGNTIFEEDVFEIKHDPTSGTAECQADSKSVDGRRITLIDTPGFLNIDRSEEELRQMERCITENTSGPHAFLIVLKVEKFTKQDEDVIKRISQYFPGVFKHAAFVFTHGDQLPEGMKIEEFVEENKCLSDLVKKCSGSCHVLDNKYWKTNQQDDYRSNKFQVAELLKTIDKILMENKGRCYKTQKAERAVEEEGEHGKGEGYTPQWATSKSVLQSAWIKLTGPAAGLLAEAFLGTAIVVLQKAEGKEEDNKQEEDVEADEEEKEEEKGEDVEEKEKTEQDVEETETEEPVKTDETEKEKVTEKDKKAEDEQVTKNKEAKNGTKARQGGTGAGGSGFLTALGGLGIFFGIGAALLGGFGALSAAGIGLFAAAAAGTVAGKIVGSIIGLIIGSIVGSIAGLLGAIGVAFIAFIQFLKSQLRRMGILLLVVVFYLMLLLSFGVQIRILGTLLLILGVVLMFAVLVLLLVLL